MVGEHNNPGVVGHLALIQRINDFSQRTVHRGGAGEVGLRQRAEVGLGRACPVGGCLERDARSDAFGDRRKVGHVAFARRVQQDLFPARRGVVPPLRREQRQVWVVEAQRKETRFAAFAIRFSDLLGRPLCDTQVGVTLLGFRVDADVPDTGLGDLRRYDQLLRRVWALAGLEARRAA